MQNVGLISVRWHRPLLAGKLKNIIILRKPSGWYVCLQVEAEFREPAPSQKPAVGVDVGIHHALALSAGTVIDSPQWFKASLKKLRVLRRRKAVHQLAKELEHIANQRRDWWHKVVHQLMNTYGLIAIEDLSLSFMLRNGNLSRATHDVALGIFYQILDYQAIEAGVEVVKVNPKNTSQRCNGCGAMNVASRRIET